MRSKRLKFALGVTLIVVTALVLMVRVPVARSAGDEDSKAAFTFS